MSPLFMPIRHLKKGKCQILYGHRFWEIEYAFGHVLSRPLCCHLPQVHVKIKQKFLIYSQKQRQYNFKFLRYFKHVDNKHFECVRVEWLQVSCQPVR